MHRASQERNALIEENLGSESGSQVRANFLRNYDTDTPDRTGIKLAFIKRIITELVGPVSVFKASCQIFR
jgi:hypothetical protein